MSDPTPVAVTSRSFSRHPVLRGETLRLFPNTRFNDEGISLRGPALADFLNGVERAITALEPIDEILLARLPDLKLISKVGVGTEMIDFDACARHGVKIRTHPGTNSRSVAELALALMIAALRHIVEANRELLEGRFQQLQGGTVSGRTVGIIGFGAVGRDLRGLLGPFGCPVLVHDIMPVEDATELNVTQATLDDLMSNSDIVSLHCGLNESTYGMIGAERLAMMREGAVLVNTARGGLIDEDALHKALQTGVPWAAALDVFAIEPPGDHELLHLPNVVATPHIGGSTEEAVLAMGRAAVEGLMDRSD